MSPAKRHRRKGGAFLILVVALLVVVVGASQAMLRGEVASQRNRLAQRQSDALLRAISAVGDAGLFASGELTLPIDADQSIRMTLDEKTKQITADWVRGETVLRSVTRPSPRKSAASQSQDSSSDSEDEP